ncbi:LacI family transcriptional regulator [Streptomyces sp. LBL]|uniref:LacI family DNA-binding transcriptional regulator n=1 Tax=Streptomyces sp. LBL TaxID=2940562 RepID=UPI00247308F6|nr:LacI family DNA-binding transcriptional regulator [Streptomyces sp. LBL]MDH6623170.1 LacI family transcriptional regulator [Streptomyces sp. LBL]
MVTLADVARAAGVSKATASRALSRPDMVAADTRERVLAAAGSMGFEFNASARALTTGRTNLIGVLVPSLANPYFAPIVTGVQRALSQHGDNILLAVSEGSQSSEHELAGKLAARVDGLVFIAPVSPDSAIRGFMSKLPVVTVDRTVPAVPGVLIDTPGGVADIVTHLAGLGHRAMAYVGGPEGSWMAERRHHAVEKAARLSGVDLTVLGPVAPRIDAGLAVAQQIAAERNVPAVVAYSSYLLLGLHLGLRDAGVRVPEDVSLAASDDLTAIGTNRPDTTALRVPLEEAGMAAVRLLQEANPPKRARRLRIATELIVGGSTARATGPKSRVGRQVGGPR